MTKIMEANQFFHVTNALKENVLKINVTQISSYYQFTRGILFE